MRSPLSFNVILLASYEQIIHTIVCVPFEFEYFARPDLIAYQSNFDVPDFFRFPFVIDPHSITIHCVVLLKPFFDR